MKFLLHVLNNDRILIDPMVKRLKPNPKELMK
jgi:hypothetical protein